MMFSICKGHAAVLVLALTQCVVFASLDNVKNGTRDSTELIGRYLKLPWMEGLDWLVHSSESVDAKKIRTFIQAVVAGEPWATQMLDTLFEDFGDMEERRIRYVREYHEKINRKCTRINADNDTGIEDGYCVSSPMRAGVGHTQSLVSASVPSPSFKAFSVAEISMIVFFSMIGVALLGCTVCDFVKRSIPEQSSATVDTLAKFSLYRNALAALNTKTTADTMPAIQGLRFLSFWTVIFGHRWLVLVLLLNKHILLIDLVEDRNTVFGLFFEMATYAVDTFCVIGGFFLAYMFFKMKRSGLKFNVFTMYLYRYLRLTPCVAVLMVCVLVFSDRFGSGPTWDAIITNNVDPCRENWWINLLFLQNVISPDRICMLHTWYLGLDMQLFWLSPLILYPLYHSPKLGLRMLGLSLAIAVVTPAIVLALKGYSNLFLRLDMDFSKLVNNFSYYYMSTYNRAFPHLLGILLGYDVATRKRHFTKTNVAINWIVTGLLILFCTWLTNVVFNSAYVGDWQVEILAALLLRPSWSIATAWVVYACTQGYGGLVTKFLSLPIFLPLGRLSYCIYLVHIVIQVITISSCYEYINPSPMSYMMNGVFGDLVLSTAVAFVFHLCIESPTIVLAKILLDNRDCKPKGVPSVKHSINKLDLAKEKHSVSNSYEGTRGKTTSVHLD